MTEVGNSFVFYSKIEFGAKEKDHLFEWTYETIRTENHHLLHKDHKLEEFHLIKSNLFNDYVDVTIRINYNEVLSRIPLMALVTQKRFIIPIIFPAGSRMEILIKREDDLLLPGEIEFFFASVVMYGGFI